MMDTDRAYAEQLAAEYAPKDARKVVALRKLDRRAKLPAAAFAYGFGTASALVMGVGMCLSMGVVGGGGAAATALGVVLGLAGLGMAGANYPLYRRMLERGMSRYAEDIVRLASEIAGC